jgi:hypothetical protein
MSINNDLSPQHYRYDLLEVVGMLNSNWKGTYPLMTHNVEELVNWLQYRLSVWDNKIRELTSTSTMLLLSCFNITRQRRNCQEKNYTISTIIIHKK